MKSPHKSLIHLVVFLTNFRIVATGKWIIFILAALVCGSINYFQNSDEYSDIAPQTGQYLTCKTDLQGNSDVFSVYVTDGRIAEMASERLCNDKTIKRQYGEVKVTIGQSDYDTFRYINHGVVDLALVKSNVVDAFGADQIYGLTKVASHPDYSAFFIALRERPLLSKEYLLGKKIGLLDYPSSRSGHIVPKTVLQNLRQNLSFETAFWHSILTEPSIKPMLDKYILCFFQNCFGKFRTVSENSKQGIPMSKTVIKPTL